MGNKQNKTKQETFNLHEKRQLTLTNVKMTQIWNYLIKTAEHLLFERLKQQLNTLEKNGKTESQQVNNI